MKEPARALPAALPALLFTSLFSSLLAASGAQAALVTVEYSVPVASIAEEYLDPYSYDTVDSTQAPGFHTYVGDPVTGRFTYDDAAPLLPNAEGFFTQAVTHTLSFGQGDTVITFDNAMLATTHSGTADSLALGGNGHIQNTTDPLIVVNLAFLAPSGTHAPGTLPTAADWQHYAANASNPFQLTIHGSGYNVYLAGGDMSLQVSAVPEPATGAMVLAGLAIVAAAARRGKAARA